MKKLTPLHYLWILFGLQGVCLIGLALVFAVFEPKLAHLISQIDDASSKFPLLKQRIDQADFDHLHEYALSLVDSSQKQAVFVQGMETNLIRALGWACILCAVLTFWLGATTFQLQRSFKAPSAE